MQIVYMKTGTAGIAVYAVTTAVVGVRCKHDLFVFLRDLYLYTWRQMRFIENERLRTVTCHGD